MKVAIYVRVSTQEQAESGYSLDQQKEKLKAYAKVRDWQVVEVYEDGGFTGSNINRPALQKLITDALMRNFDAVLVYKLDRLSRSQKDTLYIIEDILLKNGLNFFSLMENIDTDTPFGKAMIGILAVFAQLEREQITERMRLGKLGRAKSGKTMAWSAKTFGYDLTTDKKLIINEDEAQIVRQMFEMCQSGISTTKIVMTLNDEGYLYKTVPWSYRTVRQVLDNPVYAGYVKYRDLRFEGEHKPIISKKMFNEVSDLIASRNKKEMERVNNPNPFRVKYLLSGRLFCDKCGSRLHTMRYQARKTYRETEKRIMYGCLSHKKHRFTNKAQDTPCGLKIISKDDIERFIFAQLRLLKGQTSYIVKPDFLSIPDKHKKELVKISERIDRINQMYAVGNINEDDYQAMIETVNRQRKQVQRKLNDTTTIDRHEVFEKMMETIKTMPEDIRTLDIETQKVIIDKLIESVHVSNDSIKIKWKFKVNPRSKLARLD